MLSLDGFSRLARRAHMKESDYPMDINPARTEEEALKGQGA
jgi:multicomponent K+:H+ antiporter subunit A